MTLLLGVDPPRHQKKAVRALHMALNVVFRRNGVVMPACDGPECDICKELAQSPLAKQQNKMRAALERIIDKPISTAGAKFTLIDVKDIAREALRR